MRAQLEAGSRPAGRLRRGRPGGGGAGRDAVRGQAIFLPKLAEALALAGVIAKHMHRPALAQPAVKLGEKLAPLGFSNRRLGRPVHQRPKGVETPATQRDRRRGGIRRRGTGEVGFAHFQQGQPARPRLLQEPGPGKEKRVGGGNLRGVFLGAFRQRFRFAQYQHGLRRQVIEQDSRRRRRAGRRGGSGFAPRLPEQAQLAGGRQRDGLNLLARDLGQRIKLPQGLQFVAEKLQPHRPGAGEGIHIQDAATQGQFALLRHPRFRLVAPRLEPFNHLERIQAVAARQRPGGGAEGRRGEGALQQRGHAGDDEGRTRHAGGSGRKERDQGFQALADDIHMRQPRFVGQDFPGGIEQGGGARRRRVGGGGFGAVGFRFRRQPGCQVLLRAFLRPQPVGDEDEGAARE